MQNRTRSVSISRLPGDTDYRESKAILAELQSCINVDRPAVVLDCSALRTFDKPTMHLLLCCLEEAMKRNGDVRLAVIRPEARVVLQAFGVDSLFSCFETIDDAIESYRRPQVDFFSLNLASTSARQSEMNAA